MKIIFIISSLDGGGAERVLSILANELVKENEVNIILLSNSKIFYNLDEKIKITNANLYNESNSIFKAIINNITRIMTLKKMIQNNNPDIVISFMTQVNILSIISAKLAKKKIIVSERINYNFLKSKIWRILRYLTYRFSDALVVQSNFDKQKYYFYKNVQKIHNPLVIKEQIIKKENIILAVGRLDKQKGFDRLIEIYSRLKTNWKLYIAGDGEEKNSLLTLIEKKDLQEKVFLIGRKKDIEKYYAKASIFTLTSYIEGFPNVLVEAMAYRCAVISFDILTGPSEIIDNGENGFLVEDNHLESYINKLQLLIDNDSVREEMAMEATKIKEKLAIETIVNEWKNLIKEVI
jgi:GalNAc-alpha-(1->4)-GalNAc-alpha-(1->3)-diNAcBac-PP-undecaprenol alpha-1,4-N-acetyl-D-galactosaminyltransferase